MLQYLFGDWEFKAVFYHDTNECFMQESIALIKLHRV